jgi:2-methylisocitrate lyase-like PEP mutase family enzyme
MSNTFESFRKLHYQEEPLLLGNVWDAQSAKAFEKLKYQAIGTSSAAVAESLGYEDGENMPFDEYLFVVKRIKESTTIPLTVDLEGGYGKTEDAIVENIKRLYDVGVAGINIEDSIINKAGRTIVDADQFTAKLKGIVEKLKAQSIEIFINVRCDAFLMNVADATNEAVKRIKAYDKTGVHGIFLPCITNEYDIKATVAATSLPVSVMCMPGLPDFTTLSNLKVKRISMGPFLSRAVYKRMEELSATIQLEGSFAGLFK